MEVAEAIYLSPKAASSRLDILENVAATKLKTYPSILRKTVTVARRSRGVMRERDNFVHSEYTVHLKTGEVMICLLGGKGRKLEPLPVEQINRVIEETRALVNESIQVVAEVQAQRRASR